MGQTGGHDNRPIQRLRLCPLLPACRSGQPGNPLFTMSCRLQQSEQGVQNSQNEISASDIYLDPESLIADGNTEILEGAILTVPKIIINTNNQLPWPLSTK